VHLYIVAVVSAIIYNSLDLLGRFSSDECKFQTVHITV